MNFLTKILIILEEIDDIRESWAAIKPKFKDIAQADPDLEELYDSVRRIIKIAKKL